MTQSCGGRFFLSLALQSLPDMTPKLLSGKRKFDRLEHLQQTSLALIPVKLLTARPRAGTTSSPIAPSVT